MNLESGVLQVHVEDIIPNRFQPRLNFDEQGLKELSDSIKEHGIIQPLVLRKLGDKYEIIAGERRYKAAQMAGLSTVPAVISNIDDNKSAEVALVENVQRRDLTAIEEARSYKSLLDKGYLTQEQLAKRMGLSQPSIANKLRLLNLDEEVQQALLEEKISERHARTLLTLSDKAAQREWLHRIINERLTVRQLDMELKKYQTNDDSEDEEGIPLVSNMPSIEDIRANAVDISMANKPQPAQASEQLETLETLDDNISTPPATPFPTFDVNQQQLNNNFTPATSVPEFNITSPNSASTLYPEITSPEPTENKFFNNSGFNIFDTNQNSSINPLNMNKNNNELEIFDNPTLTPQPETIQQPEVESPIKPEPFNNNFNNLDLNSNNRFFTSPTINNEVTIPEPEEKEIDPMDAVAKLENPSLKDTPTGKMDLKDAIAFMRKNIESLGEKGFYIDVEEIDFDSNYQITMRIHKDN
ncbi:MAG TPA: hypothetical protein DCE23_05130 [Firmicutes bacterium]|nr:hypothetical protein [Bacillota bacterium]